MNELRSLQQLFQRYLLHPDAAPLPEIVGRDENESQARLSIYASAYRSRLVDALQVNYPKLAAWLGKDEFARLALGYLAEQPSHYRSIRDFGDRLGEFLGGAEPWRRRQSLPDMARFEWALAAAFDAADAPHAGPAQMQAVPAERWAGAVFVAHPSVRCIDLDWNVVQIWKALDRQTSSPHARRGERRRWLIWRRDLQIRFRSLTSAEAAALGPALDGRPFGELCERLCEHFPSGEVAGRAAALLRGWLESGVISEIHIGDILDF